VLHPYYKLAYIKLAWGGPEEQAAEIAAGNLNAKDWQDEAKQIVEKTVSVPLVFFLRHNFTVDTQMAQYYKTRPSAIINPHALEENYEPPSMEVHMSQFDKHRMSLLFDDATEGWASELRRYLSTMQRDVKKDTDIIEWWQVSEFTCSCILICLKEVL
jgi:hypothetical protein